MTCIEKVGVFVGYFNKALFLIHTAQSFLHFINLLQTSSNTGSFLAKQNRNMFLPL